MNIGVVGLGGLGHMVVKFAKAFGANVTVISTSPSKKEEALQHLGADKFLLSNNPEQIQVRLYKYYICNVVLSCRWKLSVLDQINK